MIAVEDGATASQWIATEGAAPLASGSEIEEQDGGLTIDCTIIEGDRWGSSGYYPASVLERDGATTFHEGLQSFVDHAEVGKDSATKLVGVLKEAARYVVEDGVPKLKAPIHFFSEGQYNSKWVKERMPALGLSIRAGVTFEQGTRAGRSGRIVTAFKEGISVDVVTRAGAGGKFGTIKESEHFAPSGSNDEGNGDVPLTKEELEQIGQTAGTAAATAVAEALKKPFADLTNAFESAQPKPEKASASFVNEELGKAKLSPLGQKAVWDAYEAEGSTKESVEKVIAAEVARLKEFREGFKIEDGHVQFDEDGKPTTGTSVESASLPTGWAVATEGK